MKNTMKKILCTVLVVILCLTSAPIGGFEGFELPYINIGEWLSSKASAAYYTEGYYTYTVTDSKATITDVDTSISGDITIPSVLGGYSVTMIGEWAFDACMKLRSVTIPNSVTTIGEGAFYECHSLIDVIIPESVTTIGYAAFSSCDSLTSVTIPNSVTTIGGAAFGDCHNLTSVIIGDGVTSIGPCAFSECLNLTSITVDENNTAYSNDSRGGLFDKNKTLLIQYPTGDTNTSYTMPSSVTSIGEFAFYWCNSLTSITIPNNVTLIGECAFSLCDNLTSVTIGDSVTTIGNNAFSSCDNLTSVTIGDSVTTISYDAFSNCYNLTSVTIGDSVTSIEACAFRYCSNLTCVYYGGTENQWKKIYISYGNEALTNATIHFLGEDEPHTCFFGDWFTETEPTVFNEGVSKRVCQCGKSETKAIAKLESGITKDQTTNIEIVYREENFDNEFTVVASEEFLDKDIIFGDAYQNFKVYDISLEINNQKIQPKGCITVKIPLPEYFNSETTAVYYIGENNMVKLESKIENGFVIFETDHFSLYAIVDIFENTNSSENCSHNCHKGGISGFFWKIINFFNKIFKLKEFCSCGAKHW